MDGDHDDELDELVEIMKRLRGAVASRPELLNLIRWPIEDEALVASDEFQESLAQVRRGEGIVLRPLPPEDADESAVSKHNKLADLRKRRMSEAGAVEEYETTRLAYQLGDEGA